MANKFVIVPEELYRGLTSSSTGDLNLDFAKHELDKVQKERLKPDAKNVRLNQQLRHYLQLRNQAVNKPINVAIAGDDPYLPHRGTHAPHHIQPPPPLPIPMEDDDDDSPPPPPPPPNQRRRRQSRNSNPPRRSRLTRPITTARNTIRRRRTRQRTRAQIPQNSLRPENNLVRQPSVDPLNVPLPSSSDAAFLSEDEDDWMSDDVFYPPNVDQLSTSRIEPSTSQIVPARRLPSNSITSGNANRQIRKRQTENGGDPNRLIKGRRGMRTELAPSRPVRQHPKRGTHISSIAAIVKANPSQYGVRGNKILGHRGEVLPRSDVNASLIYLFNRRGPEPPGTVFLENALMKNSYVKPLITANLVESRGTKRKGEQDTAPEFAIKRWPMNPPDMELVIPKKGKAMVVKKTIQKSKKLAPKKSIRWAKVKPTPANIDAILNQSAHPQVNWSDIKPKTSAVARALNKKKYG
jgi:hypothetical protein